MTGVRLASFTMARNESPLIGPFCDQLETFFDYSIVLDHCSSDSSVSKFQSRLSSNSILSISSTGYPQSEAATLVMRLLFEQTDADYVFFLDCDEFLPFDNRKQLVELLMSTPTDALPYLRWRNLSPETMDGNDIFKRTLYQSAQLSPFKKVIIPRRLYLANPHISVSQGYHDLKNVKTLKLREISEAGLLHIPVPSRAKFVSKVVNSAKRIEADNFLKENNLGTHWIDLLCALKSGALTDNSLRALALSYPAQTTEAVSMKLPFAFPYLSSRYQEVASDIAMSFVDGDFTNAFRSPRAFLISSNNGSLLFDSEDGDETSLAQHVRSLGTSKRAIVSSDEETIGMIGDVDRSVTVSPSTLSANYDSWVAPLFSLPQKMPASAWYGHIPFLFALMKARRPKRFLELGVHYGSSLITACTAAKSYGLACEIIGVDTWQGDEHAGHYSGDDVYATLDNYLRSNFQQCRLIRSTFREASKGIEDGSIDILHIDGLHTYEAVRDDYETWLPKMKDDGVMLFHDTCVFDRGFGVHQLWREIAHVSNSLNFPHSFGLGVLFLDADAPSIQSFAPMLGNEDLRQWYYRLCADVGETVPFRMGYVDSLMRGSAAGPIRQESSVRRASGELIDAVRKSVRYRLATRSRG